MVLKLKIFKIKEKNNLFRENEKDKYPVSYIYYIYIKNNFKIS